MYSSSKILLFLVAIRDLELEQLDVKTVFLHGEVEEWPEGFMVDYYKNIENNPV
jgi:hypothetical protein